MWLIFTWLVLSIKCQKILTTVNRDLLKKTKMASTDCLFFSKSSQLSFCNQLKLLWALMSFKLTFCSAVSDLLPPLLLRHHMNVELQSADTNTRILLSVWRWRRDACYWLNTELFKSCFNKSTITQSGFNVRHFWNINQSTYCFSSDPQDPRHCQRYINIVSGFFLGGDKNHKAFHIRSKLYHSRRMALNGPPSLKTGSVNQGRLSSHKDRHLSYSPSALPLQSHSSHHYMSRCGQI